MDRNSGTSCKYLLVGGIARIHLPLPLEPLLQAESFICPNDQCGTEGERACISNYTLSEAGDSVRIFQSGQFANLGRGGPNSRVWK